MSYQRTPETTPADGRIDGVADDERLVVDEVAVGRAEHQAVADRVQGLPAPGCGMHVPPPQAAVNGATGTIACSVLVADPAPAKLTFIR